MSETSVSARKRVLRSDLVLEQQCNVLWACALFAVIAIQTGMMTLESHVLATIALIVLGVPLVGIGVMKVMHPLGNAMLKRSKKVDFVDDLKNPRSEQKRLPAMSINGSTSSRVREIRSGLGGLLVMLALYSFIVVLSFAYQSSIYFYLALAISVCIVLAATFLFVREKASGNNEAIGERPSSLQDSDDPSKIPELQDSYIAWTIGGKSENQIRISRAWLITHLFFLGIWLPLVLAIPLIGPLFGEVFWVAIGTGIAFVAVLEVCSMFIFAKTCSRMLEPQ